MHAHTTETCVNICHSHVTEGLICFKRLRKSQCCTQGITCPHKGELATSWLEHMALANLPSCLKFKISRDSKILMMRWRPVPFPEAFHLR